jgi:hypothetical protein
MSLAVAGASARRIETSSQNFLAKWASLGFGDEGGVSVSCPVTLDGSFHSRTTSKVSGQLIGYINRAFVATTACVGGTARANTETLPWHIQYNSFVGTLPAISGVNLTLIGAKFEVLASEVRCTSQTSQATPGWGRVLIEPRGRVTGLRALEEHKITLGGSFFCGFVSPGFFSGTASVTVTNTATAITIRLVQ